MNGLLRSFFVILVFLLNGCSTYQVNSVYSTSDPSDEVFQSVTSNDVTLKASIVPTLRFSSVGLLGVPVVPLYLDSQDKNQLRLNIVMSLKKDLDFSFDRNPCFTLDDQRTLCPRLAEVSARAYIWSHEMHGKDFTGRVLKEIDNFYGRDRPKLIIRPMKSDNRISRAEVYRYYEAYQGEPQFERFDLTIDYVYDCSGPCPERVQFKTGGLVSIQGLTMESKTLDLKRNKAGKLDLTVPIN